MGVGVGVGGVEEREKVPGNGGKEWNLLVVDDLGTVTPLDVPTLQCRLQLTQLAL